MIFKNAEVFTKGFNSIQKRLVLVSKWPSHISMPFFIIVTFSLSKITLHFNLVNCGIERSEYFVNIGITCPTVAAGGSNGSRTNSGVAALCLGVI